MLQDVSELNFGSNHLGSNSPRDLEFLKFLMNCTVLSELDIDNNHFGGSLPDSIGNFSNQLSLLYLGRNDIFGQIPETLGNLIGLTGLGLEWNSFTREVPSTFGRFGKMQLLFMPGNQLSGGIQALVGNLTIIYSRVTMEYVRRKYSSKH